MSAIVVTGVRKTYASGTEALKGVSLNVEDGDFFALLGMNGAGKSTLIGILSGLVKKTGGSVSIYGRDIDKEHDLAKEQIGIVPQEFNFSIFEKVWDIVITQAGYYGLPEKEAAPHAEEVLRALGLWEKRAQPARALSGGMKRRLMIARALVHKPKLLILDEPTAGVDVELRIGMWEYLRELNAKGTTILMTTHYLEEAERLCRNMAIIHAGQIVKQGNVLELLKGLDVRTYVLVVDQIENAQGLESFKAEIKSATTLEVTLTSAQSVNALMDALKAKGVTVADIRPQENPLERLFLETIRTHNA